MKHYIIYQPWTQYEEVIDQAHNREEAMILVEEYAFHGIDCLATTDPFVFQTDKLLDLGELI
jgi:hypothetical protein